MKEKEHKIKEAGGGQAQADTIILGLAQRRKRETFSIGYLWQSIANGVRKVKGHYAVKKQVDEKWPKERPFAGREIYDYEAAMKK